MPTTNRCPNSGSIPRHTRTETSGGQTAVCGFCGRRILVTIAGKLRMHIPELKDDRDVWLNAQAMITRDDSLRGKSFLPKEIS